MAINPKSGGRGGEDTNWSAGWRWLKPYAAAIVLLVVSCGIMYAGDSLLLRYGFPWALFSLLVVGAAANLLGTRPAVFILLTSALFGDLLVPDLHISYFHGHDARGSVGPIRVFLFLVCGSAAIWLAHAARKIQGEADRRRQVVKVLQDTMSPAHLDQIPGYDLHGVYSPASREEEVGGDFYDVYPLSDTTYGILIGDVVGKGKEAAVFTAMLRYSVRAFAGIGIAPDMILQRLNDVIMSQRLSLGTATLFVGTLDNRDGTLIYASAGHEPPMLRRATGDEESLDATGPPLGIGIAFEYTQSTVKLNEQDALLLVTDGVTEARNKQGQFLQSGGTWSLLRKAISAPTAAAALTRMQTDVINYIGDHRRDDIAMLLLRRKHGQQPVSNVRQSSKDAQAKYTN